MRFDLLTIFPQIFDSYLNESIIKRAVAAGKIEIHVHDIRKYSANKHHKVDDSPYGGGPGMVMAAQPIFDCIQEVKKKNAGPVFYMSPRGAMLTQKKAEKLYRTCCAGDKKSSGRSTKTSGKKKSCGLILLCGRYEGIDQRAIDLCVDEELSIGKYVLTGGELPAMVVLDVLSRFVPGVLGDNESTSEESFSRALNGKKEYPQYTKPPEFKNMKVPAVLTGGNHAAIKKWRMENLS
jgi:tRNA (guanine37-N1)-methyltransferase